MFATSTVQLVAKVVFPKKNMNVSKIGVSLHLKWKVTLYWTGFSKQEQFMVLGTCVSLEMVIAVYIPH